MSYYLGIDIGGTNLRAALIDEDGKIIEKFKVDNEVIKGPEYNIDKLVLGIKERWENKKIKSIGLGCPGPLDIKRGVILVTPNLSSWEYFNIKSYLERAFNLPVEVNNDANVAALSEALVGAGKGKECVYYITLSTGVGGGFIYKGEIIGGANSIAAEVGNMIINDDKYKHSNTSCGGVEGQCSGVNIARIASERLGEDVTTKEVFQRAKEGNKICDNVLKEWQVNVAKAMSNIIVTVDPDVIVLGGSVIINNPEYLYGIIEETKKLVYDGVNVDIRLAQIGDDAGLVGAGLLTKSKYNH